METFYLPPVTEEEYKKTYKGENLHRDYIVSGGAGVDETLVKLYEALERRDKKGVYESLDALKEGAKSYYDYNKNEGALKLIAFVQRYGADKADHRLMELAIKEEERFSEVIYGKHDFNLFVARLTSLL